MYPETRFTDGKHKLLGSVLSTRRRLRPLIFYLLTSFCLVVVVTCIWRLRDDNFLPWTPEPDSLTAHSPPTRHPIDTLKAEANVTQKKRLEERPLSLKAAASQYRARRGRHPPPGFEEWYKYAERNDAIIVESFFDRIYKDVAPLWGLDAVTLAQQASNQSEATINFRGGKILPKEGYGCATLVKQLLEEVAMHIPDLDMPVNCFDESRLFVPWDVISSLTAVERERRVMVPKEHVIANNTGLAALDSQRAAGTVGLYEPPLILTGDNWDIVRQTCPPDALARNVVLQGNLSGPPPPLPANFSEPYALHGFVRNVTTSMDFCTQPHLPGMHGSLFEPATLRVSKAMYPLFGGGKLLRANELLIPDFAYLEADNSMYAGGAEHGAWWEAKRDGIAWRGSPTGPSLDTQKWRRMQRVRFVEMLNGSTVAAMEANHTAALTFSLPPVSMFSLTRLRQGTLGAWLKGFADVGFVKLGWGQFIFEHFGVAESKTMSTQYQYKFIPDIDGNGFSGRYRALLRSSSVPLKATLHAEWHDDRLMPWLHYVPMDNTFQDIYAILDYFTADKHGDDSARAIAEEGQNWAERVLRRQDMLLYVWRLLLEFARVCDQNREKLGYVGDLA